MKYLSKEELEDITNELLENPTRETLKVLNNKYNGEEKKINIPTYENQSSVLESKTSDINIPAFNIPQSVSTSEIPSTNNVQNSVPLGDTIPISSEPNNSINDTIPSLEVPQSTPIQNNNTRINFSGNLWEPQMPTIGNMMETTDNFNTKQNTIPNINTNNQNIPFFGPATESVNNPIPVNNIPNNGPSMFGQIQQNYNPGA